MRTKFWSENMKGKYQPENVGGDLDLREMAWERVGWMQPAHDMVQWRALVNTVMNLQFP
jgi:expansin (peptidoglycan-binding protein)